MEFWSTRVVVYASLLAFFVGLVGTRIGDIQIPYNYYFASFLLLVCWSAAEGGVLAGLLSAIFVGFVHAIASTVIPHFQVQQSVPVSANVQIIIYAVAAYLIGNVAEKMADEYSREKEVLERIRRNLTEQEKSLEEKLNEVARKVYKFTLSLDELREKIMLMRELKGKVEIVREHIGKVLDIIGISYYRILIREGEFWKDGSSMVEVISNVELSGKLKSQRLGFKFRSTYFSSTAVFLLTNDTALLFDASDIDRFWIRFLAVISTETLRT